MNQRIATIVKKYRLRSLVGLFLLFTAIVVGVFVTSRVAFRESDAAEHYPDLYFVPSSVNVTVNSKNNTLDLYMRTNDASVSGLKVVLNYNPDVLTDFTIEPTAPFIDLCSFSTHCNQSSPEGIVELSMGTGINPVKGDIKVATIVFGVENTQQSTKISISDSSIIAIIGESSNRIGMTNSVDICVGSCSPTNTPNPTPRTRPSGGRNTPTPTERARRSDSQESSVVNAKSSSGDEDSSCNFSFFGMCLDN